MKWLKCLYVCLVILYCCFFVFVVMFVFFISFFLFFFFLYMYFHVLLLLLFYVSPSLFAMFLANSCVFICVCTIWLHFFCSFSLFYFGSLSFLQSLQKSLQSINRTCYSYLIKREKKLYVKIIRLARNNKVRFQYGVCVSKAKKAMKSKYTQYIRLNFFFCSLSLTLFVFTVSFIFILNLFV